MLRKSGPPQLRSAVREGDFYAAHELLLDESGLSLAHSSLYKYVTKRRAEEHERYLARVDRENQYPGVAVEPVELDNSSDAILRDLDNFDRRDRSSRIDTLRKLPDYPNLDEVFFGSFQPTNDTDPGPYFSVSARISDPEVQMIADAAYELRGLTRYEDRRLPRGVRRVIYDVGDLAAS
jgi:hypothetical protein